MAESGGSAGGGGKLQDLVQFALTTTLFEDLSESEMMDLLRRCTRQRVKSMDYIIREKEEGESLYYILEGRVFLVREIEGFEEFLGILEKGDTFGETGLLRSSVRTASVRARTDCLLLNIEKSVFEDLPCDLALRLMRNIALTGIQKLGMANELIDKFHRQVRALTEKEDVDFEKGEDEYVEGLDDPKL
ncbi:MAG: cyclic nucleotide-binding domain-containing protein [bacterium]